MALFFVFSLAIFTAAAAIVISSMHDFAEQTNEFQFVEWIEIISDTQWNATAIITSDK